MVTFRDLKEGKVKLVFGDPEQIKALKEEEERVKNGNPTLDECTQCDGSGKIECEECNGEGFIDCDCGGEK